MDGVIVDPAITSRTNPAGMASYRRVGPRYNPLHLEPEDVTEKEYQISGSSATFHSNMMEFDENAVKMIREINRMHRLGHDGVEPRDDFVHMDPVALRSFLENDPLFISHFCLPDSFPLHTPSGAWKLHSTTTGYCGIWLQEFGYSGLKQTFVYYEGNHKTNWVMNKYFPIHNNTIKRDDFNLCHVFRYDGNYDPRPMSVPTSFDFNQVALNSRAAELEALFMDPSAFKDYHECDENSGAHSTRIANGSNGKRSLVWEEFTEIEVLGHNDELVLTLAICHHCSMAYKTGGLKPKRKGSTELVFKNNGTKTLEDHKGRCSGQKHIADNPQGAPH